MGLARALIENGQVPPPEAFSVEGMFSEHDLPVEGETCRELLCLRSALALAPTLAGEPAAWMQVGLSSTIDPETYQRGDVSLIATVDVSGSMGWDYSANERDYPTPGSITRDLLRRITTKLTDRDDIAIVTYGSDVDTALEPTPGSAQDEILAEIAGLSENGSTNMEAGLERAYELAREIKEAHPARDVRILLFTDAQPNVGETGGSVFEAMAKAGAEVGIGVTIFGVGLGLGQNVVNAMSHLRGGNAFSLFESEHVGELMEDSWPWMISPIAYDLKVKVRVSEGAEVGASFGFPSNGEDAVAQEAKLEVSTVFLSKRKGAVLVRIDGELRDLGVEGTLSYETPAGVRVEQELAARYEPQVVFSGVRFFEQSSVEKSVALAIYVSAMKEAAELYAATPDQSVSLMEAALERFTVDVERINGPALRTEITLGQKLLDLLKDGASQGELYGRR